MPCLPIFVTGLVADLSRALLSPLACRLDLIFDLLPEGGIRDA